MATTNAGGLNTTKNQKHSERFEEVIRKFLNEQGAKDPIFMERCREMAKKYNRNTKECCNYILNEVKNSGRCAMTDDEVYSLAMHYWQEEPLVINAQPINCAIILPEEA